MFHAHAAQTDSHAVIPICRGWEPSATARCHWESEGQSSVLPHEIDSPWRRAGKLMVVLIRHSLIRWRVLFG